jgi:ATP-GRASP peptide maturase of grasp-with-spasm system
MITFILSSNNDQSTNTTIDWLNRSFQRLCYLKLIVNLGVKFNHTGFYLFFTDDSKHLVDNTTFSYWYRRDDFVLGINSEVITEENLVRHNLEIEWDKLKDFLHTCCESKNSIGSYRKEIFQNKLATLFIAQQIGLYLPPTIVTTQKDNLIDFIRENGECITKAISNMFKIETTDSFQTIGTQLVTNTMIQSLDETFFPTLLQKKITKIFELRIFYLKGKFYPMAIFSQNDDQTQLDYRNYNRVKPNRNIPYILPEDIEEKLQKLMDKLDLDTGSIDIMVTPEGEYVFLEVNPTGQFGWVSENCNYYLEEKIARCLEGEA